MPDKTKEAANEANKIIKDQGSLRKVSAMAKTSTTGSPNSETGSEDNKSSSPFGVRLRKVVRATLTLILCHCSSTSVTSFKNESLAHYRTLDKKVQ